MSRFVDDEWLGTPDQLEVPIANVASLIHELELSDADEQTQTEAITCWLQDNDPSPALVRCMARWGWDYLL
jgi:hypothetical protein